MPGQHGRRPEGQRHHRQDVRARPGPPGDRRPPELHAEQVDQAHRHQELGDRRDHHARRGEGELGRAAAPAPGGPRHRQAQRHRDQHGEPERVQRELDRRRQPVPDHLGDRQARGHRDAEVAGEQVPPVVQVLQPQRVVEPQRLAPGLDDAQRRHRAQRRPDGVARDQVDHQERRGEQDPHRDEQPSQPAYGEPYPGVVREAREGPGRGGQTRHRCGSPQHGPG